MPTSTIACSHAKTARLDEHELARRLVMHLGATLVAVLAGVRDAKLPHKWAKSDGPTPRPESLRRLQTAHRAWSDISDAEGEHVARLWFIGTNPHLGEEIPPVAIANDRHKEVFAAVRLFLDGSAD